MHFAKSGFRSISLKDIPLIVAVVAFPIHVWSILNMLHELPAWLLRLSIWELIGVIAYVLSFALIESLIISTILIFIGVVVPKKLIGDRFLSLSSAMILLHSVWAMAIQYNYETIRLWGVSQFLPWLTIYLISSCATYLIIQRYQILNLKIRVIVGRIAVLSSLYILFDVFSVLIVIFRNA